MKYVLAFIMLLGFWLLFTYSIDTTNLIVGAIATLITMLFFARHFIKPDLKMLQPQRYFWFIVYLFIFIWECIIANFDVAYMHTLKYNKISIS